MSGPGQHHALSRERERVTLFALGAVQFTHIFDYMIIMPLGAQLMRVFEISPAQFTHLVASYGLAAALSGFAGGFLLDRFDRKRALLIAYTGFGLSTLACGLAPTYQLLLLARFAAGAFGGLAGSLVTAMVADVIPPARRGRAMSFIMAAFPVASVLGVPTGLVLAGKFGWHAPFFLLAGCAVLNLAISSFALPHLRTALADHQPVQQMKQILSHRLHLRAFAVGAVLVMSGGVLIPFLAPSFIANVGLNEKFQLPFAYAIGGIATAISTPIVGWLSDHIDRLRLLAIMSTAAIVVSLFITRLGPSPLWLAALMMALFMVTMSGRFAPAMAMVANAVEGRYRGGFMSVNSALQQLAAGLANIIAGPFVLRDDAGHLNGFPALGYVAAGFFALTVLLAFELRAAAPHVSTPAPREPAKPTPIAPAR
ncbi:MAG TPA: MFS transporter [Candidatus Didemnitutus sp.]|nr:MFS transporter [Candidatus Didemnitutus sp.]